MTYKIKQTNGQSITYFNVVKKVLRMVNGKECIYLHFKDHSKVKISEWLFMEKVSD